MRRLLTLATALTILSLSFTPPAWARVDGSWLPWTAGCKPDAVQAGQTCVDKYEASVWSIPTANTRLIAKVRSGRVTLEELTNGGATQVSPSSSCSPGFPGTFPDTGNWTDPLYAVSIPGVHPTACVTWFQAEQACALSGKRLLTNQEWQRAAAGTPDPGAADDGTSTCVTNSAGPANTGARSACVSNFGAFDMVGNVVEWVADWVPPATSCSPPLFGTGDLNCMTIDPQIAFTPSGPGALVRGGYWGDGAPAGVFAVGDNVPSRADSGIGFRCAR